MAGDWHVTIRGVPVIPLPDIDLRVYSYAADPLEHPDDFFAGPATGW